MPAAPEALTLRPALAGDAAQIRAWLRRPEIARWWGSLAAAEAELMIANETPTAIRRMVTLSGRDVGYGQRNVSGTLGRGFENHDFFDIMSAGTRFDIRAYLEGAMIVETNSSFTAPGGAVTPFRYSSIVDVFECSLSEAGANVGGPGRMVENINWGAEVSDTESTELRIRLYNLTASYS